MKKNISALVALLSLLFFPRCGVPREGMSKLKTDLGSSGNAAVQQEFFAYEKTQPGCVSQGGAARLMLSGFGAFSGDNSNISGVVTEALAQDIDDEIPSLNLRPEEHGARVTMRQMVIAGVSYDVCFLLLSVQWDLAAAILVREMERFQPDVLMMTGRGASSAVHLEGGAINRAFAMYGYDGEGNPLPENKPVGLDAMILAEYPDQNGRPDTLPMTWEVEKISAAVRAPIKRLGHQMVTEPAARMDNDYICNNVSYVTLSAQLGRPLSLADGLVQLSPAPHPDMKIGFWHYPAYTRVTKKNLAAWKDVITQALYSQMNQN